MRTNDKFEHPEVIELLNICAVSPDAMGAREVCDLMLVSAVKSSKKRRLRKKIEDDLDEALDETLPASDAVAHY